MTVDIVTTVLDTVTATTVGDVTFAPGPLEVEPLAVGLEVEGARLAS